MPCLDPAPPPCRCYGVDDLASLGLNACFEFDYNTFTALALSDADELNGAMVEVGNGWGVCTMVLDGAARVYEIDEAEALACESVLLYAANSQGLSCE